MEARTRLALVCGTVAALAQSGIAQCEFTLTAQDPGPNYRLGTSVAVQNGLLIAGSPGDDEAATNAGAGIVFGLTELGWVQLRKLLPDVGVANEEIGIAVSIDGDRALLGADGAAYVFSDLDNPLAAAEARLHVFGAHKFGEAVALSGNHALVGAWGDDELGSNAGAVYAFRYDNGQWNSIGKLLADDGASADQFGRAVAVEGQTALIGAPGADTVYVFEYDDAAMAWNQVDTLSANATSNGDRFGQVLAMNADRAAVSAPLHGNVGAIHVFALDGDSWLEEARLVPPADTPVDVFGISVALGDDHVVAGARTQDHAVELAYVFQYGRGGQDEWTASGVHAPADAEGGVSFGNAVGVHDGTVLVAAPADETAAAAAGAVIGFERNGGEVKSYCTSNDNSTGDPAAITANGTPSISENSLVLVAQPVPNQMGIFLYGTAQVELPFGDGVRCVGGNVYRLPFEMAEDGKLRHELDVMNPPNPNGQITAGSTWNFQAWFRDAKNEEHGYNLSDAISISFCP